MQFESLIGMLIVGALAGWLSGKIMQGRGFGLFGNIVIGVVGAFLAGSMLPALGFAAGGSFLWSLIHATLGAVVLLFVIGLIRKAR
jgi:uncharacterized membrane protein YeaQ/YmgE (transglycosylase-associated protein family)